MNIPKQALQHWQNKALDNPALIVRNTQDNLRFDVIFKYLKYNDIIIYCVEWEDAVDCINKINGIEIESSES